MRQKDPQHPYHNVSGGSYSNFESLEFGQLITAIDKPDEYTVRFTLARAEAPFVAIWPGISPLFYRRNMRMRC
jgi:dipeptide transport system substrate-binding protein